jgi:hypothetical protein
MTTSPNVLNVVAVSTTTSPVTHTAEVAVNNASIKGNPCPDSVATGKDNKHAPSKIVTANPSTKICVEVSLFCNNCFWSIFAHPPISNQSDRLPTDLLKTFGFDYNEDMPSKQGYETEHWK